MTLQWVADCWHGEEHSRRYGLSEVLRESQQGIFQETIRALFLPVAVGCSSVTH